MNNKLCLLHKATPSRQEGGFYLLHRLTQRVKENEDTEDCVPKKRKIRIKVQTQTLKKWRSVIYLIVFQMMVIKMLTEVRRTMCEQSENFNKEIENIRKYQTKTTEL